ncbi:hypothetical protein Efla_003262 [Eimeria flavescens]
MTTRVWPEVGALYHAYSEYNRYVTDVERHLPSRDIARLDQSLFLCPRSIEKSCTAETHHAMCADFPTLFRIHGKGLWSVLTNAGDPSRYARKVPSAHTTAYASNSVFGQRLYCDTAVWSQRQKGVLFPARLLEPGQRRGHLYRHRNRGHKVYHAKDARVSWWVSGSRSVQLSLLSGRTPSADTRKPKYRVSQWQSLQFWGLKCTEPCVARVKHFLRCARSSSNVLLNDVNRSLSSSTSCVMRRGIWIATIAAE